MAYQIQVFRNPRNRLFFKQVDTLDEVTSELIKWHPRAGRQAEIIKDLARINEHVFCFDDKQIEVKPFEPVDEGC